MLVPDGGFYYFLSKKTNFEIHFKTFVHMQMAARGLDVTFTRRAVSDAYELWIETSSIWGRSLKMRIWDREGLPENYCWQPVKNYAGVLSPIKLSGQMLWCLNHCKPIEDIFPLSQDRTDELIRSGVNVSNPVFSTRRSPLAGVADFAASRAASETTQPPRPDYTYTLLETYPNELMTFRYVELIFWHMQYARNIDARIDLARPPMTKHYLTNLCYYLKCGNFTADNLYMVFKSLDLMGLNIGD